jgi:hypothetical protein
MIFKYYLLLIKFVAHRLPAFYEFISFDTHVKSHFTWIKVFRNYALFKLVMRILGKF